jgi:hypothetical protein
MLLTPEQVDLLPSEELRPLLKKSLAESEALRQRVADLEVDNPDRVIQVPVTECEHCLLFFRLSAPRPQVVSFP